MAAHLAAHLSRTRWPHAPIMHFWRMLRQSTLWPHNFAARFGRTYWPQHTLAARFGRTRESTCRQLCPRQRSLSRKFSHEVRSALAAAGQGGAARASG
eukprot:1764605-Pleurochrysis_carterae.AAC.2